ncbi:19567_t:CDS:2, partial [Racocetra persica]
TAMVVVRLTPEGTVKYNSEKSRFIDNLQNELIESIPTNSGRLQVTNRFQYDPSAPFAQYLLQIKILSTNDYDQASVSQIINDMKVLIKDKDTSIMSINNYTKYLDSSYGLTVNINFWDEIIFKLIGLLIGCIILIIIALWACRRYPK